MQAGESARTPSDNGAIDTACESGDEGPRKRSASPTAANQLCWDNPAKKFCTEGINVNEWVKNSNDALPGITDAYKVNYENLLSMGLRLQFDNDEVEVALRLSNNDVEKAIQYLTREIGGLDAPKQGTSAVSAKTLNDYMEYVESDEEEIPETSKMKWSNVDAGRVRLLSDHFNRHIFFHKNGSLARCLTVAKNIMIERAPGYEECQIFVDEILYFAITRHVNPPDPVFLGEQEIACVEDLYHSCIPVLCQRLTYSPVGIKVCLVIDELFNIKNKFFTVAGGILKKSDRIFHPPEWCDLELVEKSDSRSLFAELVDEFVQTVIPCIDKRLDSPDEETSLEDVHHILRTLNVVTGFIEKKNERFLERVQVWMVNVLQKIERINDKEVRDGNIRRLGLEILQEIVVICERFQFDVFECTQASRMEFLKKWIKSPQMECMLHALEELGMLADRISKVHMTFIPVKSYVTEAFFKKWLDDNKVLQIVLTGNMDLVVYVERVQPILQYMTPELTNEDLKFVWSLRKGRMGVSVENFNRIMDLIMKSLQLEQIEWVIELFKKSFRNREIRMFEVIFNYLYTLSAHKNRNDGCKLRCAEVIWELITLCRGPPLICGFKSIEVGMKKHCDIMNSMYDRNERDAFLMNMINGMKTDEGFNEVNVIYMNIQLEKLRKLYFPKRIADRRDEENAQRWRDMLIEQMLFENMIDRLQFVRKTAHEIFQLMGLNALASANQDSCSNAIFEDGFNLTCDNVLNVPIYGCTTYGFILINTLRLMKWLNDNESAIISVGFIERLFDDFLFADDAMPQEKAEIFTWLHDFKMHANKQDLSRKILSLLCRMDVFTLQYDGLKCFSRYLDQMPNIDEEDGRPIEAHIMNKMNECKLFLWKLILFNDSDQVVDKCIETFCEREVILVNSPKFLKNNTLHFLSVFAFYVGKLKAELYARDGKEDTAISYDPEELEITDDEIKQHDVPLENLMTEAINRSIDRLIRFLTRFVELGNEKNNLVRQFPSHGSCISGHTITFSIELKNEDEDLDVIYHWKTLVCDANTTVAEFKIRLAKRVFFNEYMTDFTVHRREDEITMPETQLKYDYLTLQGARLATETDSIFLSEKVRILVKQRRINNKRFDNEKGVHEAFLPAAIVSKCNFYDLFHELSAIGDKLVKSSVKRLLNLLPTHPYLYHLLTNRDEEEVSFPNELDELYTKMHEYQDPSRFLYFLETLSSIAAPTRMTPTSCDDANELCVALARSNVLKWLSNDVLKKSHTIPTDMCSANDRHAILERSVQILRAVYIGRSILSKSLSNEQIVRKEMKRTIREQLASRQTRAVDPEVERVLTQQQTLPEGFSFLGTQNFPKLACDKTMIESSYACVSSHETKLWPKTVVRKVLTILRDFVWVHVATESQHSKEMSAYVETKEGESSDGVKKGKEEEVVVELTASEMIRKCVKRERWGDECRLVIVRKVLSLIRHIVQDWIENQEASGNKAAVIEMVAWLYMKSEWVNFYLDVLVNSYQEAYRKYIKEMLVRSSKTSEKSNALVLRLLLESFNKLPFHVGHTADLTDLERRQRRNCDCLVSTVTDILFIELRRRRETQSGARLSWSEVGINPYEVACAQIESFKAFRPRFSTIDAELYQTENSYCSAKMRLINGLLPFLEQYQIENLGKDFIEFIIEEFLFPEQPDFEEFMYEQDGNRWEGYCREQAIHLINTFCEKSYKNMQIVFGVVGRYPFVSRQFDPNYKPIIRPKAYDQVGLKNDGGTCYMNATLQQLVHVPELARQLISLKGVDPRQRWGDTSAALLVELQKVFAQLMYCRAQACVPHGLWREFRFDPDVPLNTKQHHDAIDFYSILLDKCDEVIKKLKLPSLFQDKFYGKYSYEKICYGCWHRYKSPDEQFNCVSLALAGNNLEDAFENFLEAHVMEGDNAYHCEKCNEKKTTLNRTSFLELPTTLTIQLKRMTYDMINNMIKKDNQFFKFPFEIDMQPYMLESRHVPDDQVQDLFDDMLYQFNETPTTPPHKSSTAEGISKTNGASSASLDSPQKKLFRRHRSSTLRLSQSVTNCSESLAAPPPPPKPMIYELVGVLAHSGIATAGHYYSFVKERRDEFKDSPSYGKWYHLNDMAAQPMQLASVEDLWFGGNFAGDERVRHWNAYVLFYEKKKDPSEEANGKSRVGEKPKVIFDISDEKPKEEKAVLEKSLQLEQQLQPGHDLSEARKLRIKIFHELGDTMKRFLNEENAQFLRDRDFFSFDLYQLYVNSCLALCRRESEVKFNLENYAKSEFFYNAFLHCFAYISNVAWQMFDDARPKFFPKHSTDLLKALLNQNPKNKYVMMASFDANNQEVLNALIEISEQDIRHSVWATLRYAMRLWCMEASNNSRAFGEPLKIEGSSESSDAEEDDDIDDDEDEDDDIDESVVDEETVEACEDTESDVDDVAPVRGVGIADFVKKQQQHQQQRVAAKQLPSALNTSAAASSNSNNVEKAKRNGTKRSEIVEEIVEEEDIIEEEEEIEDEEDENQPGPSDRRRRAMDEMAHRARSGSGNMMMIEDPHMLQRNLVMKACFVLQLDRIEFNGRHFVRHAVDFLHAIAKVNAFGLHFLLTCNVLNHVTNFYFVDVDAVYATRRYREARMKTSFLWPHLPSLFFELLLAHLQKIGTPHLAVQMRPFQTLELMASYFASKDETPTSSEREDPRAIYNRVTDCFVAQILLLSRRDNIEDCNEYILDFTQMILREIDVPTSYHQDDRLEDCVNFVCEITNKLLERGYVELALKVLDDFVFMQPTPSENKLHVITHGLLPLYHKWMKSNVSRGTKMLQNANLIPTLVNNSEAHALLNCKRDRYPDAFKCLNRTFRDTPMTVRKRNEEEAVKRAAAAQQKMKDEIFGGAQQLKRSWNSMNLISRDQKPIATARIVETNEIDLEEQLKQKKPNNSSSENGPLSPENNNQE